MEYAMKTKEAAEYLGVDPKTIRNWTKQYEIPCKKNGYGHYVFEEEGMRMLHSIKSEKTGMPEQDGAVQVTQNLKTDAVEEKIQMLMDRIDYLEKKLESKADEVVAVQLLNHREEIEETTKKVEEVIGRIEEFENKVNENKQALEEGFKVEKPKKRKVLSFFSF
ncbi:helix-turn-helix domain-containing protein [Bacillus marinisedimentorum]|uniref:helix-turn-helix domain-containing protein n=1 Tax=Bacillus marinisedimentorum TaxID=1821260 RepID=UPI0012FF9344|nr:helix-turn-helix domain-containing protein [Bacillus marinisedimentorum]